MSIFELLLRIAGYEQRPRPHAAKEVIAPYTWPMWRENRPDWTSSTMAGYAEAGYAANAVVYACIMRKATSAAFAPLVAYTGQRDEPERLADTHPLMQLLLKPNGFQSWFEYMETLITYLDLDGNAFVYKARANLGRGPVEALYPLRPDRVRPVPKDRQLLGFVYEPIPGRTQTFLVDEIIHVRYPNPLDPFEGMGRGTSPLSAAARPVDVDNAATSFLKQFFDNAVVPFGLLKTKQTLVDSEVQRIRERMRAQYGGANQWGDVMILDADAEYQRLGLSMQEMTFGDLDARDEARICAVLGVPPIVAGVKVGLDKATYANYASARRSFWEDTLIPGIYHRFEDAFNNALVTEFGPDLWVAYDYSAVPALREDQTKKWEMAVRAFLGGVATRNEARALIKLAPVPDEDDGFRAADQQQVGVPAITQTPPTVTGKTTQEDKKRYPFGPQNGKATLDDDGNLVARLAIERRGTRKIMTALKAQLALAIPDSMTAEEASGAEQRLEQGTAALRTACYQVLRDAVMLGVNTGIAQAEQIMGVMPEKQATIGIDWELVNEAALAWVRQATFDLVTGINDTSRQRLRSAIARWVEDQVGGAGEEGEFISPLEDLFIELEPVFGRRRAELIAVTEVTRAYAEGNIRAWQASGVITKIAWRTANDERVCPICSALGGLTFDDDGSVPASIEQQQTDGVVTDIGVAFVHPGGHGDQQQYAGQPFDYPPAHPRCRCWVVPVMGT